MAVALVPTIEVIGEYGSKETGRSMRTRGGANDGAAFTLIAYRD